MKVIYLVLLLLREFVSGLRDVVRSLSGTPSGELVNVKKEIVSSSELIVAMICEV